MLKVAFVNMPFAVASSPSIALTQLQSVLKTSFPDQVDSRVFYVNHDFARDFGLQSYESLAGSLKTTVTGVGDWFFRKVAFPELPDDVELFLRRYSTHFQDSPETLDILKDRRETLASFLDDLIDRYALADYDVVGLTSMFVQSVASIAMARRLKRRKPEIVTVLGGANCETVMGQALAKNVDVIDFVFSGPSLKSFPEFVGHLLADDREKCHSVYGALSKKKLASLDGADFNEVGGHLDIDVDVPLDYEDFLASVEEKALEEIPLRLFFETSRGCWWGERSHCTFCGLNGLTMSYSSMQSEKALTLFQSLFSRYHPKFLSYASVDNIMPREYLTEVFPKLEAPDGVTIFYEVKADLKEREMEVLAAAGVTEIQPGIESLSTSVLKLMRKGTTASQNVKFLKNCLRYGIRPLWNLLVGFPGEEEEVYESYLANLPLLTHLPPPSGAFPIRFDRFSPYFKSAKDFDLELEPYDFYEMIYPFDRKDIERLAYYFSDVNYEATYMSTMIEWLPRLQELVESWHSLWKESDGKPELRFVWEDGRRVVRDTRPGQPVEHSLTDLDLRLLDVLDQAMKVPRMARALETPEDVVEKALASLRERKLIFQDRDLYMSLVVKTQADEPVVHAGAGEPAYEAPFRDPGGLTGREESAGAG